jgi:hypothetical protein
MKRAHYIFCLFLLAITSVANGYSIFESNGKVGLKNEDGKVLIPAKYEALGWSDAEFSVLSNTTGYRSNGKWGLISLTNHIITKAEFESIAPSDASFVIVRKKSSLSFRMVSGVVTTSGKEVIPAIYDGIKIFSLRAIVFSKVGDQYKYGLVDLENKTVIPQQFKNIKSIGSLRYAVENFDGKWALFTETGKQMTSFTIDSVSQFKNNYAIIYQDLDQGLIDRDGVVKIEPKYREIIINDNGSVSGRQAPTWMFLDGQNNLKKKVNTDSISGIGKNLLKITTAGVVRLTDSELKVISNTKISALEKMRHGKSVFYTDQKCGVIRSDGSVIIEPIYTDLRADNHYYISNAKRGIEDNWILLDSAGKPLHTKSYDLIHASNKQLFPVVKKKYWGAINTQGKEIISCTYDSILQFLDDKIVVKFRGQYGVINKSEHWLVTPRPNKIRMISSDRFLEYATKTTYLKSFDNNIIYFSDNKLVIQDNTLLEYLPSGSLWEIGMNGVIGDRNQFPELVEKIYPESEGLRGIKKNGQYGFIDALGRLRIANRYDDIHPFSDGLAAMKIRGKWGFIGHDDRIAIQPVYDEVGNFRNGLALVKQKGLYGVVDKTGKQVIIPRYDMAIILPNRNIIVKQNNLLGLFGPQGNILINAKYNKLDDLNNGYIIVERDGKYGAITAQGVSTIPLIYDYLTYDPFNKMFYAMINSEWADIKF